MAQLNVLLLLLLSFIATIHVVNGIDLEIGGAPYFGTVTSTTRLSFTIVHNNTDSFAIQFSPNGVPNCVVDMSVKGPKGSQTISQARLDDTVVWNQSPFTGQYSGVYTATLATRNSSCPVQALAISESPISLEFGKTLAGSLPEWISANYIVLNQNSSQFAVSLQATQGSCELAVRLYCNTEILDSASVSAGGAPYVLNTMNLPYLKPADRCSLGYRAMVGSCSYNIQLIEEPVNPINVNAKSTGELSAGLGVLYKVLAGQFTLALSATSGSCVVNTSYKSSTGVTNEAVNQPIAAGKTPLTFTANAPGAESWQLSILAVSGACQYALTVTA